MNQVAVQFSSHASIAVCRVNDVYMGSNVREAVPVASGPSRYRGALQFDQT